MKTRRLQTKLQKLETLLVCTVSHYGHFCSRSLFQESRTPEKESVKWSDSLENTKRSSQNLQLPGGVDCPGDLSCFTHVGERSFQMPDKSMYDVTLVSGQL